MHIPEILYHLNSDLFRYKVQEFCPKLDREEGCLDLFDLVLAQPTEDDLGLEREYTPKFDYDICKARLEAFGAAGQAPKIKVISLDLMSEKYQKGQFKSVVN